ncbi:hypothetical protein [Pseudobacteriovorax antillogorgiicola]|uniref:F5/8 type C domain-containing protein n=1 Tax=Pseudobacteriovorax antillogorgiicola TaxID=1513793 RepID=A0A1Y6CXT5_9BACT|nr:hypothetical protein [Pseudobacteriovorax antillogorgiicola]TCS40915.1 hypothetical protein EDD56_1511 [Pseudobacteriovorax antillogorgiicola]SMF83953.1 hypothetical protein SAMN06296036_1511 [Pseudobacteriovorax antillogorgiicola]
MHIILDATDVWLEADFLDRMVTIEGLEIVGGEVPDFAECAPDSYGLKGSNDGINWVNVEGSFHEQDTSGSGVRYYFEPREEPLSPIDYRLVSNPGSVYHSWTTASGSEVAYLLVRSQTPVPFSPVDGVNYESGTSYDHYEVIYEGTATSYFDNGLASDGTVYYYSLLSFDSHFRYSDIVAEKAIPEERQKHKYFRFHIDSIYGCTDPYYEPRAYTEELSLFLDGEWYQVIIDSEGRGSVAGKSISVRSSVGDLANSDAKALFDSSRSWISPPVFVENHCNANAPVFAEVQFSEPVALTGYRVRAGDYIDQRGYTLYEKYYGQPDKVHWEFSDDGEMWNAIIDSYLDDIIYQDTEVIW